MLPIPKLRKPKVSIKFEINVFGSGNLKDSINYMCFVLEPFILKWICRRQFKLGDRSEMFRINPSMDYMLCFGFLLDHLMLVFSANGDIGGM